MSINGISTGYIASYETRKTQKAVRGNAFSSQIGQSVKADMTNGSGNVRTTNRNSAMGLI